MKRLLSLLLAMSLLLSLAACGGKTADSADTSADAAPAEEAPAEETEEPAAEEVPAEEAEEPAAEEAEEPAEEAEPEYVPAGDGLDFTDITYERYDASNLRELIAQVNELTADAANADRVLSLFEEIEAEEDTLALSYEVSDLYSSIDATDEYYADESSYSYDLYCEIDDDIGTLGCAILNSPCGDAARAAWTEDEVEYYSEYVEMTDEQLDLFSREQELVAEYDEKSLEDLTTTVNGKECTSSDLVDLYYAGEITYDEYYDYYDEIASATADLLGPIYIELLSVRNQIAASYGYETYADYAYTETYDRDYTPEDALELAETVKDDLYYAYYIVYMSYDSDCGLDELAGSMAIEDQMAAVKSYLAQVSPDMEENFTFMEEHHLYNLEYSDTKLNTGFTTFFNKFNVPFLFNQPDGSFYDIMTLVHEFGHFNSFMVNADTAADYQNIDLAEIASQGLEMLYTHFYGDMLGEDYADAAELYTLLQRIYSVMDGCMYDEFQQKVYQLEDPTVEDINKLFAEVANGYGYYYEDGEEGYDWVLIPHNFENPFYYISYAVSVLPAFEIWEIAQDDFDGACRTYTDLVALGEVGTFRETLAQCGLSDPFSDGYISDLTDTIIALFPEYAEEFGEEDEEASDSGDAADSGEEAADDGSVQDSLAA